MRYKNDSTPTALTMRTAGVGWLLHLSFLFVHASVHLDRCTRAASVLRNEGLVLGQFAIQVLPRKRLGACRGVMPLRKDSSMPLHWVVADGALHLGFRFLHFPFEFTDDVRVLEVLDARHQEVGHDR